ncbi:MAG: hypothetical protein ACJ75S_11375 [Solirubrobacterales bacterium]
MSDSCPLPVDWLDYCEGSRPELMSAHLGECPSCRELVVSLSEQPGHAPPPAWAERFADTPGARLHSDQPQMASAAELWLSAVDWQIGEIQYEAPQSALLLVLSSPGEGEGLEWLDVAPVRSDVEGALPTDFLLDVADSSYETPLRVVFSLQCKVERRQLHCRVGALTDADLLQIAFDPGLSAWRWGNPLESVEDPRLWWDSGFSETIEALRAPWLQWLEHVETEAPATAAHPSQAQILSFVPRRRFGARGAAPALAAAASDEGEEGYWELVSPRLRVGGVFDNDWEDGRLIFVIGCYEAEPSQRLRLVVYLRGLSDPLASEALEPYVGLRVYWNHPGVPGEVEQLRAEVIE